MMIKEGTDSNGRRWRVVLHNGSDYKELEPIGHDGDEYDLSPEDGARLRALIPDEGGFSYNFVRAAERCRVDLGTAERCLKAGLRRGDCCKVDIAAIYEMKDGSFLVLTGRCDTTGWDCQGSAEAISAKTLDLAERYLSADDREIIAKYPTVEGTSNEALR